MKDFDSEKFYLGTLCQRGHDWDGTGKSLRFLKRSHSCVTCEKITEAKRKQDSKWRKNRSDYEQLYYEQHKKRLDDYKKQYYERNKEHILKRVSDYRKLNKDKVSQSQKQTYQRYKEKKLYKCHLYYPENKDKIADYQKKHRQRNIEVIRVRSRTYSQKRRARKRQVHQAPYTIEQIKSRYAEFNNRCAYCGIECKLTLDHFISMARGGSDTLSNFVPACSRCNSSKCDLDPWEWYQRQDFYSLKRWRHILKVLGKTETNYNQLPLF